MNNTKKMQERLKAIREAKNFSVNYVNTLTGIDIEELETKEDLEDIDAAIIARLSNIYRTPVEFIMFGFDRIEGVKEPKITSEFIVMLETMYDCKIFEHNKSPQECFDAFVEALETFDTDK